MAWLFPHADGAVMLRYKGGRWVAERRGRRIGGWTTAEEGAAALHAGVTGEPSWDTLGDCAAVPPDLDAWRYTYDDWEDQPPAASSRVSRRPRR
jgi:hypothetical protein